MLAFGLKNGEDSGTHTSAASWAASGVASWSVQEARNAFLYGYGFLDGAASVYHSRRKPAHPIAERNAARAMARSRNWSRSPQSNSVGTCDARQLAQRQRQHQSPVPVEHSAERTQAVSRRRRTCVRHSSRQVRDTVLAQSAPQQRTIPHAQQQLGDPGELEARPYQLFRSAVDS